jgi:hypothetical protein
MNSDTVTSGGDHEREREYDLKEAAQILGKTPDALRMQIRRGTIKARKEPIPGDETGLRGKIYIPQSEVDKERVRIEAETARADARRAQSTMAAAPERSRQNAPAPAPVPAVGVDIVGALEALATRQEQFEQDLRQEREDTRALIRSVEKQVDMLQTLVTAFMAK